MRLGVSLNSTYAVDDPRDAASRMLARARGASAAGLDSLFVGDHHGVPVHYLQNSPVLGRILAEWQGPVAGALYLLPLWHPTIVAEQLGTLAALTDSRIVLQCALGGGDDQFALMGQRTRDRVPRFESGLDVIRRLLAGEALDRVDTPWGPISGSINPVPDHVVDVWIGADVDPAIDRAARLGNAWYGSVQLPPAELAETYARYRERCAAHDNEPTCSPVRRDVYVGVDDADVRRVVDPVVAAGYRGMDPSALVTGTVSQVAEQIHELGEMGFTDVIVRQLAPDQSDALASLDRLSDVRSAL